ncbi:MAG: hypothetical protein B7Z37_25675, partial [Verrucomicrobia bacterium 12-59-8]
EATALNKAFIPALAGAASTYLLTAAGGTQGIEVLLRQPAFKENFRQWFKAVAAGSVKEGLREEAPDQLIQGMIERYTYNPNKPWKEIIEETLQAGIGGALLGGAVEATTTGIAPAETSQDQPQPPIPPNTTPVGRPSTPPLSAEQSQKLIHNVMNRPPEQRGHPTTQADLAQAQWVVREQARKLESQKEPLNETQKKALADAKAALARVGPSLPSKPHVSGGRPELPEGAKLLQSSEHYFIFERDGKKWVRFYAPEARSPNSAKKGGRGGGDDDTAAFLTPEGRIYVDEGQHRLNSVVLDGKSTISTVQGHPKWLEYEYKGTTDVPGEPPAYNPGKPHENVNRLNKWDGMEGY